MNRTCDPGMPRNAYPATLAKSQGCELPPSGWYCTRAKGHVGPCAAIPDRYRETESTVGQAAADPPVPSSAAQALLSAAFRMRDAQTAKTDFVNQRRKLEQTFDALRSAYMGEIESNPAHPTNPQNPSSEDADLIGDPRQ